MEINLDHAKCVVLMRFECLDEDLPLSKNMYLMTADRL